MSALDQPSAFAPFRHKTFVVLWTATLVANIGTWFRDVANGWAMTELAPSPTMVALVQAATTLPVFLLSLPAGALADLVDRKRLLIRAQMALAVIALALTGAALTQTLTPWLLLGLTFIAGIATALMGPAWQSIVPELVPKPVLRSAIAMNSLGINIARAIGPALGGAVVASVGIAVAYLLDAVSYLLIILALVWWQRAEPVRTRAPERFGPAMVTGLRYLVNSPEMARTLVRAAAFFVFASAYWALLPLIARQSLGGDAALYGALLTAVGGGAVTGALVLPRLSSVLSSHQVVVAGSLLTAAAMVGLAWVPSPVLAGVALFVAGFAWISVLTTLNVAAQTVLPNWVRARGLAIYITVFFGAMTLGSVVWGQVAEATTIPTALLSAAGGALLALVATLRLPLARGERDLTPSYHWPEPATSGTIPGERGPVLITVTYTVAPKDRAGFLTAIHELAGERLRDGGYGWHVFEDAEEPTRFTEVFFAPSWIDHLRQHDRVTKADQDLQAKVNAFHTGSEPPRVAHLLAANGDDTDRPAALPSATRDIA